ncbi:nitroreductase family protein [Poriferisphaera sp. WC338]|uniref:nitroreductase family protein n=1 Tax=Poriferisphaera sp. WC338 TaxID=3425129 RepID=UPI003D818212
MSKHAKTHYKIHKHLVTRWSPRSFANKPVETEKLHRLFEAARWAASSYNEQPWRFIVARKENSAAFEKAIGCLLEANQAWAKNASMLILTAISTSFAKNGKPNRVAIHDLGLAIGNMTHQATEDGLYLHQMAGVDLQKVRDAYQIPDGFEPVTAIAVGYLGNENDLPEDWMREQEAAERTRKGFNEIVFGQTWGEASDLF